MDRNIRSYEGIAVKDIILGGQDGFRNYFNVLNRKRVIKDIKIVRNKYLGFLIIKGIKFNKIIPIPMTKFIVSIIPMVLI